MPDFTYLTPDFAFGPQITPEDIEQLRDVGFASILNARPDDEFGEYMDSAIARKQAEKHGMAYGHCPTESHSVFEPSNIDCFEQAMATLPKPVFAHCKSGTRATILWALVVARHREVEDVIKTLRAVGEELEFLEQEMRDSAIEAKKSPLRLKDDALLSLGGSSLLGKGDQDR